MVDSPNSAARPYLPTHNPTCLLHLGQRLMAPSHETPPSQPPKRWIHKHHNQDGVE